MATLAGGAHDRTATLEAVGAVRLSGRPRRCGVVLDDADLEIVLYTALGLTLLRMVLVAPAVAGMGFRPSTIAFMGCFGFRSPASIVLALVVAEEEPELPGPGVILTAMAVTILASIALHGLSTEPSVWSSAREAERPPPSAAELRS